MKIISFLFLTFLATSYANQALLKGLAKISKDPTGAAILSAISLNLKAKTPLSDIDDLLQDIYNGLLAQSQEVESNFGSENDRLSNAISNDQALNEAYQNTITTLDETISNSQSSLTTSQESLNNNQQALGVEQQAFADRAAAAQKDLPQFDQDIQDLKEAIQNINDAISKMRQYQQSSESASSFIQTGTSVKDRIKKVTDNIQAMKKKLTKHSNMFTPLVRELVDLSATLNQAKSDKVIDLLTQLLNLLTQAESQTETQRATYSTDFNSKQEQSQQNIDNYQSTIAELQQNIQGLNDKLTQAATDLESAQENLKANNEKLAADQASQKQLQDDYNTRKTRSDKLIEIIRQAIDYFNQNLSQVDDYVAQKIQASL